MAKDELALALNQFNQTRHLTLRDLDGGPVPGYVLWRLAALASDVTSAVESLEAAQEAIRLGIRSHGLQPRERFETTEAPIRQAMTAFKAVYIFVRAYQDVVCGFLLELQGRPMGRYQSMKDCLKERTETRRLLDEKLPGYAAWFKQWRNDRDAIKIGAQFTLRFDANDYMTVSFAHATGQGAMAVDEREIGLKQLVEGIQMSAAVTAVAFGELEPEQVIRIGPAERTFS